MGGILPRGCSHRLGLCGPWKRYQQLIGHWAMSVRRRPNRASDSILVAFPPRPRVSGLPRGVWHDCNLQIFAGMVGWLMLGWTLQFHQRDIHSSLAHRRRYGNMSCTATIEVVRLSTVYRGNCTQLENWALAGLMEARWRKCPSWVVCWIRRWDLGTQIQSRQYDRAYRTQHRPPRLGKPRILGCLLRPQDCKKGPSYRHLSGLAQVALGHQKATTASLSHEDADGWTCSRPRHQWFAWHRKVHSNS